MKSVKRIRGQQGVQDGSPVGKETGFRCLEECVVKVPEFELSGFCALQGSEALSEAMHSTMW